MLPLNYRTVNKFLTIILFRGRGLWPEIVFKTGCDILAGTGTDFPPPHEEGWTLEKSTNNRGKLHNPEEVCLAK